MRQALAGTARTLAKSIAKSLLGQRSLLPAGQRVVLVYHDISAPGAPQYSPHYSTPPETFAAHLDIVQRYFDLVALDDLVSPEVRVRARPLAALTFDDGFRSVRECGQPILAARGIPFTLFVNSLAVRENRLDYLAQFEPPPCPAGLRVYLDAREVVEMARAGVQIGSHTTSHRVLAACSDAELDEQIGANKTYLESLLGMPVRHLALPYGKKQHYDRRALDRCFASGHRYVYSTNPRPFTAAALPSFARNPIPRIGLSSETRQELLFVLNRPLFRTIDI